MTDPKPPSELDAEELVGEFEESAREGGMLEVAAYFGFDRAKHDALRTEILTRLSRESTLRTSLATITAERDRMREALRDAISEVEEHNREYEYTTTPARLTAWRAALSATPERKPEK